MIFTKWATPITGWFSKLRFVARETVKLEGSKMVRKSVVGSIVLLVVVAVCLVGCGSGGGASAAAAPSGSNSQTTTTASSTGNGTPNAPTGTGSAAPAGSASGSSAAQFIYFGGADASLSGVKIDASGTASLVAGSPFQMLPSGQVGFGLSGAGNFLFTSTTKGSLTWRVDPVSGALTQIASNPQVFGAWIDPSQNFAYDGTWQVGGGINAYQINQQTGALTLVPGSPFPLGALAYTPVFSLDGTWICSHSFAPYGEPYGLACLPRDPTTGAILAGTRKPQ